MVLRLIVPAPSDWTGPTEVVDDRRWRLSEPIDLAGYDNIPEYRVISFAWSRPNATESLFGLPNGIPGNTSRALRKGIASQHGAGSQAFWIDALCIPAAGVDRLATLESLGFIYNQAKDCLVILDSDACGIFDPDWAGDDLGVLPRDAWICGVWKHPEVFNCLTFLFTAFECDTILSAGRFISILTPTLVELGHRRPPPLPLECLNDLLCTVDLCDRSVWPGNSFLACLTAVGDESVRERDKAHTLLGNLTQYPCTVPPSVTADTTLLSRTVLRLCDAKGDFSYIYTTNPRSADRRWRPVPHPTSAWLHPLLERQLTGAKQRGMLDGHGLKLHGMVALPLSQPQDETASEAAVLSRLRQLARLEGLPPPAQVHAEQIEMLLRVVGFRGPMTLVPGQYGCIAMQHEPDDSEEHYTVWAARELRWTFGGHPGIARVLDAEGRVRKYAPVVFFGADLQTKQPERFIRLDN